MSAGRFLSQLRVVVSQQMPLPGAGRTAERHRCLMKIGHEDLSLARLAEAHFDALAILAEAGRTAEPGALYGVWASEIPGKALTCEKTPQGSIIAGSKMFCSGAGIVNRALVTAGSPVPMLIDLDLRNRGASIAYDGSSWKTTAFQQTATATVTFHDVAVSDSDFAGEPGWYLDRPGFWHGACGPAACWAGGAAGLLDYATSQGRIDAHTLAHLGAMQADIWAMDAYLDEAGRQIDAAPQDVHGARIRARMLRHLVEQSCTDVLRRLTRAYGPHPLAMQEDVLHRCQELDLYLRQSHAERDLESLGRDLKGL